MFSSETRIIDLTVGQLQAVIIDANSKLIASMPVKSDDELYTIDDFIKVFKVERWTVNNMRKRKPNPLPFTGKGKLSRITKSIAHEWWNNYSGVYKK
jgi:hypothetical protein